MILVISQADNAQRFGNIMRPGMHVITLLLDSLSL